VLLGKAWGITREWLVHGFGVTAYYTGFEALSKALDAVGDIL
jgi:alkylhydroperoxidase/carboxymuconolactone decarboxylase family protein YurZ